jgi:serine/threonine protein kinase
MTARGLRDPGASQFRSHAEQVGEQIARMHNAGILHLDLTPGNILFTGTQGDRHIIQFIDNNRMRFCSVGLSRGVRSLLQMMIEGVNEAAYVTAYAEARGFDPFTCLALYRRLLKRHKAKWRLKDLTRPWRRKVGF